MLGKVNQLVRSISNQSSLFLDGGLYPVPTLLAVTVPPAPTHPKSYLEATDSEKVTLNMFSFIFSANHLKTSVI